jgi:hypothetical protein
MCTSWSAFFFVMVFSFESPGQVNVLGKPGHIMTPSAKWNTDRQLGIGISYIPREYAINYFMGKYDTELIYGVRVGLTDFLEFNLNITYLPNVERIGIGDRHADIRLRVLKEEGVIPGLVLILSPPGSVSDFLGHNVLVATKSIKFPLLGGLDVTGGYSLPYILSSYPPNRNLIDKGFAFYSRSALNMRYLNGFFSAISWRPFSWVGLMAEYDGEDMHGGIFIQFKEFGSIQMNAYDFKTLGASVNLSFPLHFELRELRKYGK